MSQLMEASPQSLDELFSRDPLQLSDQDITVIVVELRRQREKWEATGAKSTDPAAKKVVPKSLSDIGL
jgi:hypothetical protein